MIKINYAHSLHSRSYARKTWEMTIGSLRERRRKRNRKYYEKCCKDEGKMVERRKKDRKGRKRKKIEKSLLQDDCVEGEGRVKRLKMSKERLLQELEESRKIGIQDIVESQKCAASQEEETKKEEAEESNWEGMERAGNFMMSDEEDISRFTSLDLPTFNSLVEECSENLKMTTFRGEERHQESSASPIPTRVFIFMALFWLRFYPTIDLLSLMFKIHFRTCTKVLKRTIIALAKTLKEEVKFPSDVEMEGLKNTPMQNHTFPDCVCVVDGTEIRISRPKNKDIQRATWSGKKHQNSLNVMLITKLNGEIIYHSPFRVGAHDQLHWNELNLRQRFVGKTFGIMGDGGFTFNRVDDEQRIIGYKPFKKPKNGALKPDEKIWNTKLAEVRVVVENAIRVVKVFKILGGKFRHFRNGKGQIKEDDILTICVALANRKIKKTPLRCCDWTASDWREAFELLPPLGSDTNEEMLSDIEI